MFFSLITPLIMRSLIDDVLVSKNVQLLFPILLGLSGLYFLSSLSNYLSNLIKGKLDIVIFKELSSKIFSTVQLASLSELQQYKTGDLQSRTMTNVETIAQVITTTIPQIVIASLGFILPFVIMFSLEPKLALIVISPVVLFIIFSWYFGNKIKNSQRPALDSSAGLQSFLKEAYSIIPIVKVFALEEWMNRRYERQMLKYYNSSFQFVKISSLYSSGSMLIYGVPTILVLIFGSMAVLNGSISLGTFTAFMAYVGLFFSPIQQLSYIWTSYKGSQGSYDRINDILSLKSDNWGDQRFESMPLKIEFEGIWFSYDKRIILQDFDATFIQGRNYIIGDNGSGKTTIIKLLCHLYSPDKGRIFIGGKDLSLINRHIISESISVVFSDSQIFDGTIFENIMIGDLSASHDKVIQAAKKAELHDFVMTLDNKYNTMVGESGMNISSGEKQKIALARVILKDTPIVIFDEFISSVDMDSKKAIFSVIRKMDNKIVIIITHDLNEIESNCNLVYLKKESMERENDYGAPAIRAHKILADGGISKVSHIYQLF